MCVARRYKTKNQQNQILTRHYGGDGGIRTLDRALQPYNGLANRRLQPLGHISQSRYARHGGEPQAPDFRPPNSRRFGASRSIGSKTIRAPGGVGSRLCCASREEAARIGDVARNLVNLSLCRFALRRDLPRAFVDRRPKQLEVRSRYNIKFTPRFARCPASTFVAVSITEVPILFVKYRRFLCGWIQFDSAGVDAREEENRAARVCATIPAPNGAIEITITKQRVAMKAPSRLRVICATPF
jgi:hypothetical protein